MLVKKRTFFIVISVLFLMMTLLVQRPYLTLGMDAQDIVKVALSRTFIRTSYSVYGEIELSDVETLPFKFQLIGAVDQNKKFFKLKTELIQEGDLFGFYQEGEKRVLTTPIKGYEKLLYEDERKTDTCLITGELNNIIGEIFKLSHVEVVKNQWIWIEDDSIAGYAIQTDQYLFNVSRDQLFGRVDNKELNGFIASQLSGQEPIQIILYIDRELQIRRMEGTFPFKLKAVKAIIDIKGFDENYDICLPDSEGATLLKGSVLEILKQFIEKQVPRD